MRTSVAQAFAENGDAFVLRGNPFTWDGKWPHLPADEAARLVADVIDRYTQTMQRPPRRLVVHKQSRFFPEERAGFQDALDGYEYDLVALAPSTGVRIMRHGEYPPPRGACLSLGDRRYLYTTGYIPSLGRYPHGHVPTPVQITDHIGGSATGDLLREVLLLISYTSEVCHCFRRGEPTWPKVHEHNCPATAAPRTNVRRGLGHELTKAYRGVPRASSQLVAAWAHSERMWVYRKLAEKDLLLSVRPGEGVPPWATA